jgi:hypothetical protein
MTSTTYWKSPFFRRTYAGFTKTHIQFINDNLDKVTGKIILDPFSGQAPFLCKLAWEGWHVYLLDINPAPLLLAKLRSPQVVEQRRELVRWFLSSSRILGNRSYAGTHRHSSSWFSDEVLRDLQSLVSHIGLRGNQSTLSQQSKIWLPGSRSGFALGMILLVARELSTYKESDNITWPKNGGILRASSCREILARVANAWLRYTEEDLVSGPCFGSITCIPWDSRKPFLQICPRPNLIVTSPPYANRLDYTRLWAPETRILDSLFMQSSEELKSDQLGSVVVKQKLLLMDEERRLPLKVRHALVDIKNGKWKASRSYYYKFFHHYAVGLARAFENIAAHLEKKGVLIVIIRDTPRKSTTFPTADLIKGIVRRRGVLPIRLEKKADTTIRSHIGMMRRNSARYSNALKQREWLQIYVKRTKS